MSFKIYIKDDIGNEIANIDEDLPKIFTVITINVIDGMLVKGNYRIPINHILFIQEII